MSEISFAARMAGAGTHRCRLQQITAEEEGEGRRTRWLFVTDAGEEIIRKYGVSWRVGSGNHRLVEQLTGQTFAAGQTFDPESLLGSQYTAYVSGSDDTFIVRFEPITEDATSLAEQQAVNLV